MEKAYKYIKTIVFIVLGIVIFAFANDFVADEGENINLYVGLITAFYGFEGVILLLCKHRVREERVKFLNSLINLLLALVMIFLLEGNDSEVRVACCIWCVYSIMRENDEIADKVIDNFKRHPICSVINLIESIVVIVLSMELLTINTEYLVEDALKHVYLLGVELILEVSWPHFAALETKLTREKETR